MVYLNKMYSLTIIIIFIGHSINLINTASISNDNLNCISLHRLHNSTYFLDIPRYAEANEICSTQTKTCCIRNIDDKFKENAKVNIKSILNELLSYLNNLLLNNLNAFKDKFRKMIALSENNTLLLLNNTYPKLNIETIVKPTNNLYKSLINYLYDEKDNYDLQNIINTYYDYLFPEIYFRLIKSKYRDISPEYIDCLRISQKDIIAFGDTPNDLGKQLERSFKTAKTIIQSIDQAARIINDTLNYQMSENCIRNYIKSTQCSYCAGHTNVKLCNGYCLNIARGCLAQLAELNKPWNEFVSSYEIFSSGIISDNNIENVLNKIPEFTINGIKIAIDNEHVLSKKVKVACGIAKRYTRSSSKSIDNNNEKTSHKTNDDLFNDQSSNIYSRHQSSSSSLYIKLQTFSYQLTESKEIFTNLGENLCQNDLISSKSETNCWNGNIIGEYKQHITGIGIDAQKYNPEIKDNLEKDAKIKEWTSKLRKLKELLKSRINIPESSSYMYDSPSGSGSDDYGKHNLNVFTDDEDYISGSGDEKDSDESKLQPDGNRNHNENNFVFNEEKPNQNEFDTKVKDNSFIFHISRTLLFFTIFINTLNVIF